MSRRLSVQAKQEQRKPRVRFPDELVFLDNIRENDLSACNAMLRKASLSIDINGINDAGLTPLHQAVLEGNLQAVKLLVMHGADVNKTDTDTWTPLHAACAEGHSEIVRYLLFKGAKKDLKTQDGERALDLIDPSDLHTIGAMLESDASRAARMEDESSLIFPEENSKNGSSNSPSQNQKPKSTTSPSSSKQTPKKKPKKKPQSQEDSDSSSSSDSG